MVFFKVPYGIYYSTTVFFKVPYGIYYSTTVSLKYLMVYITVPWYHVHFFNALFLLVMNTDAFSKAVKLT